MIGCRFEKHTVTVAILAQGTSWAVADMQALFTFLKFKIDEPNFEERFLQKAKMVSFSPKKTSAHM